MNMRELAEARARSKQLEIQEFYNKCHDEKDGRFCSEQPGGSGLKGRYSEEDASAEQSVIERAAPEAQGALKHIFDSRRQLEPEYSEKLQRLADEYGGELEGFDHRFKTADSVQNRIERNMRDGMTAGEAVDDLGDSLRYTVSFPDDRYEAGVRDALSAVKAGGNEYVNVMNSWAPDDQYDGINTTVRDPNTGLKIEIQYHTKDSYMVKDSLHKHYEYLRDRKGTNQDRFEVWKQMTEMSNQIPRPPGVENLQGDVDGTDVRWKSWPWQKYMNPEDEEVLYASAKKRVVKMTLASQHSFAKKEGFDRSERMKGVKPKKRYDISTIKSWEEAEELFEAGKIDKDDWNDWVDEATGGLYK